MHASSIMIEGAVPVGISTPNNHEQQMQQVATKDSSSLAKSLDFHSPQTDCFNKEINNSTASTSINHNRSRSMKILNEVDHQLQAEIKAKEKYVEHLKSIDLTKFSFPNE